MKLFYKLILTFFCAGLILSAHANTGCCNAGFSTPKVPSSAKNVYRFVMHDSTASDIQSVHWAFGDSTFSTERTPVHAYHNTGNYAVTLTVIKKNVGGIRKTCTETHTLSVVYACADFTYNTSNRTVSFFQTHNYMDSASAHALRRTYTWVFGDSSESHDLNPTHTYEKAGTYNVCLYQTKSNASGAGMHCSTCHTVVVRDSVPPVICSSAFNYTLSDTLVTLYGNAAMGNSYWWMAADSNIRAYGNIARFVRPSSQSFTVCHRQYMDSISGRSSESCMQCITIKPPVDTIVAPPIDTVPSTCNADFSYFIETDSTIAVHAVDSNRSSYWTFAVDDAVTTGAIYRGNNAVITVPRTGKISICQLKYGAGDSCIVCKVVRESRDTIPAICNSDFDYTITGNTVIVYALHSDSAVRHNRVWNFSNEVLVRDTLLANHTYTSSGTKQICLKTFSNGDTCTTCKDVIIEAADVTAHPNPAVDNVVVTSSNGALSSIAVYDINGIQVKNISGLNIDTYTVDVSNLVSGIYYVSTVLTDGRTKKIKIIVP